MEKWKSVDVETLTWSSTVHPCKMQEWPTDTSMPMTHGQPLSRWIMVRSWMFVRSPTWTVRSGNRITSTQFEIQYRKRMKAWDFFRFRRSGFLMFSLSLSPSLPLSLSLSLPLSLSLSPSLPLSLSLSLSISLSIAGSKVFRFRDLGFLFGFFL